jgi:DNA mismatch endonuclease (patch repair protein)
VTRASSESVSRRMARQARRDTGPEVALRSRLHQLGLRFRVGRRLPEVRSTADIVFGPAKVAVYVDGCFWHMCPQHATFPRSNAEWWRAKLEGNAARDRATDDALRRQGWAVERVWEHEDPEEAAARIANLVRRRRRGNTRSSAVRSDA